MCIVALVLVRVPDGAVRTVVVVQGVALLLTVVVHAPVKLRAIVRVRVIALLLANDRVRLVVAVRRVPWRHLSGRFSRRFSGGTHRGGCLLAGLTGRALRLDLTVRCRGLFSGGRRGTGLVSTPGHFVLEVAGVDTVIPGRSLSADKVMSGVASFAVINAAVELVAVCFVCHESFLSTIIITARRCLG